MGSGHRTTDVVHDLLHECKTALQKEPQGDARMRGWLCIATPGYVLSSYASWGMLTIPPCPKPPFGTL